MQWRVCELEETFSTYKCDVLMDLYTKMYFGILTVIVYVCACIVADSELGDTSAFVSKTTKEMVTDTSVENKVSSWALRFNTDKASRDLATVTTQNTHITETLEYTDEFSPLTDEYSSTLGFQSKQQDKVVAQTTKPDRPITTQTQPVIEERTSSNLKSSKDTTITNTQSSFSTSRGPITTRPQPVTESSPSSGLHSSKYTTDTTTQNAYSTSQYTHTNTPNTDSGTETEQLNSGSVSIEWLTHQESEMSTNSQPQRESNIVTERSTTQTLTSYPQQPHVTTTG